MALAQYYQADLVGKDKLIGEQIARLREAQRLFDVAGNYLSVSSSYSNESAAVKKTLDQAVKDNDYIVIFLFLYNIIIKKLFVFSIMNASLILKRLHYYQKFLLQKYCQLLYRYHQSFVIFLNL